VEAGPSLVEVGKVRFQVEAGPSLVEVVDKVRFQVVPAKLVAGNLE